MKKLIFALVTVCGIALSAQIPDKPLLKVFDAAYRQDPGSNVLLSPWGIQECFGMVYGGAGKISGKFQEFGTNWTFSASCYTNFSGTEAMCSATVTAS